MLDCFATASDVSTFLAYAERDGSAVLDIIGADLRDPRHSSLNEYLDDVHRQLSQRGLLDGTLLRALLHHRQDQQESVRSLARALEVELEDVSDRGAPEPAAPAGSPFAPFRLFVGRDAEMGELVRYASIGTSVLLVGARRTGKTALLRRLDEGVLGRGVVHVDVAGVEPTTELDVLRHIAAGLSATVAGGTKDLARAVLTSSLRARSPLVLVLDEADRLLGRPWTDSFLGWLRFLDDSELRTQVAFVLSGGPLLDEYEAPDDRGSPALNTAERVFLAPLQVDARRELVSYCGREVDEQALFAATGGHPFLLNRVLDHIHQGRSLEESVRRVYRGLHGVVRHWRAQLGEDGVALAREVFERDLALDDFDEEEGARFGEALALSRLQYSCLVDVRADRVVAGARRALRIVGGAT